MASQLPEPSISGEPRRRVPFRARGVAWSRRQREREGEERRAVGAGGEREREREGKAFGLSARPVRVGLGLLGRRPDRGRRR